jgi:lipopolysaccharide export system permease protein
VSDLVFRPRGEDERELELPELYAQLDTPPKGSTRQSMRAELHRRIAYVASFLMLPLLAIPFAIGRQRSLRSYRFAIAFAVVVAFQEVIERGAVATKVNGLSPWLSIWLPFGLITLLAVWRFHATCFTLKPDHLGGFIDSIGSGAGRLWHPLARRFGPGARS